MTMRATITPVIRFFLPLLAALLLLPAAGCRESRSEKPPIHLNRNMDTQEKYKPQRESKFFVDGSTMRTPVEGTVARGELRDDDALYRGKTAAGEYVSSPIPAAAETLERGRERYGIYCRPCHGDLGNGKGPVTKYQYPIPPTSYFEPRILQAKDGYIFEVISNGIRNMPAYRAQIPVRDRWCIVAHVRELQKAQLPESEKGIQPPQGQTASK
jgi:mono/diheme cytochrome c family protein